MTVTSKSILVALFLFFGQINGQMLEMLRNLAYFAPPPEKRPTSAPRPRRPGMGGGVGDGQDRDLAGDGQERDLAFYAPRPQKRPTSAPRRSRMGGGV